MDVKESDASAIPNGAEAGDSLGVSGVQPYAHVLAVTVSGEDGAYTLDVTVESADVGCEQYADWWEVVSAEGELIYRRILAHSHTDANGTTDPGAPGNTFTRDGGPVPITSERAVIVRAHMSSGGYNGAALRGSVAQGFRLAKDLAKDFGAGLEQEPPLPAQCAF